MSKVWSYYLIPIEIHVGKGLTDNNPSIDRIDPTKGYVSGNIHIISWRANRLKNNGSLDDLILLGAWANNQKEIQNE